MQWGQAGRHFCIFVFGEGSLLLALDFTRGTRIHANQHESRAYSRLLFRLIAGSRGTLAHRRPSACSTLGRFAPSLLAVGSGKKIRDSTKRPSRLRGR